MQPEQLLSRKELAARTGFGRRQVDHVMTSLGLRIGGRDYVLAAALTRFLTTGGSVGGRARAPAPRAAPAPPPRARPGSAYFARRRQ